MVTKDGKFKIQGVAVKMVSFMFKHQDCWFTPKSLAKSMNINADSSRRSLRELFNVGCVKNKGGSYQVTFDEYVKFNDLIKISKAYAQKENLVAT